MKGMIKTFDIEREELFNNVLMELCNKIESKRYFLVVHIHAHCAIE